MKTIVAYWSGTGNTESMADVIADGVVAANGCCDVFNISKITPQKAAEYDTVLLGCPSMGAETLEENEFQPFYDTIRPLLKGKKVGLFGSYGWGDGEWMRNWETDAKNAGIHVIGTLIINQNEDATSPKLVAFGKKFA